MLIYTVYYVSWNSVAEQLADISFPSPGDLIKIPLCVFLSFGDPGGMLHATPTLEFGQLSSVGIRDRSSSSCFLSATFSPRLEVKVRIKDIYNFINTSINSKKCKQNFFFIHHNFSYHISCCKLPYFDRNSSLFVHVKIYNGTLISIYYFGVSLKAMPMRLSKRH